MNDRDIDIIRHILQHCSDIYDAMSRFGKERASFNTDLQYEHAVAFSVFQIGELVGHLSDEIKAEYDEMPWQQIKAMRNVIVHHYGGIDKDILWETVTKDIPEMEQYCMTIIND